MLSLCRWCMRTGRKLMPAIGTALAAAAMVRAAEICTSAVLCVSRAHSMDMESEPSRARVAPEAAKLERTERSHRRASGGPACQQRCFSGLLWCPGSYCIHPWIPWWSKHNSCHHEGSACTSRRP